MALNKMTADSPIGSERPFEVDQTLQAEAAKIGPGDRFFKEIEGNVAVLHRSDRQAATVNRNAVANLQAAADSRRGDP